MSELCSRMGNSKQINSGKMIYSGSNEYRNTVGIIVSNGIINNIQGYWNISDSHYGKNQSKNRNNSYNSNIRT